MLRTPNLEPSTTWTSPLVAWVVDSRVRLPPEAWPPLTVLGRAPWTATITASSGLEGSRRRTVAWRPGTTSAAGGLGGARGAGGGGGGGVGGDDGLADHQRGRDGGGVVLEPLCHGAPSLMVWW